MPDFRVEVWEIQSYQLTVEAAHVQAAEDEAHHILLEMTPEDAGAQYGDKWVDVMEAEVKTP